MSFKEFDLSDYIKALEDFKNNSTDNVVKHWGSVENFDMFIQRIKDGEAEVAKLAIKQFGSVEKVYRSYEIQSGTLFRNHGYKIIRGSKRTCRTV